MNDTHAQVRTRGANGQPLRAIVTGSSSGIGRACVKQLLAEGARVAGLDIQPAAPGTAGASNQFRHVPFDLSSVSTVRAGVEAAANWLGSIDALLHFAAVWSPRPWDEVEEDEWVRVCEANMRGTFFLAQAVAKRMVPNGSGSIVFAGSDSVNMGGVAGGPAYVASKGGVIALTRVFARVLGPKGIRVNAINPGVIDTPMTASWAPELKSESIQRTPLGRLGTPEDVAQVAVFLVSEGTSFVTGEVVEVNGGFYFG